MVPIDSRATSIAEVRLQAVILVGGEGTRLRPLTYETPKPMVPLLGVPFLERTLSRLRAAGVDEVILAAGYLPSAIERYFGDGRALGMRLVYVVEDEPLGTAGALKNVAKHVSSSFFVLNGDVLTDLDLRAMRAFHEKRGGVGTLHAIAVDDPSAFGCIVRDAGDAVVSFVEKPPRESAPSNEINAGTYLLEPAVLDAIPAGHNVSIERETFPQLLAGGQRLNAFVTANYWLDVGRPHQYLQAHRDVLDERLSLPPARDDAGRGTFYRVGSATPNNVVAPAFIAEGAFVDPAALVGPYAVLGERCRLGPESSVRDAVLWDGVTVEAGGRVADAILASNVRVGRGAVAAHGAVVGHAAVIGPGVVLAADARVSTTGATQSTNA